MDTDDLSEEAYEVLIKARQINEFLWVELGASSKKFKDEEEFLNGMLHFIQNIKDDPAWFQDMWLMEDQINQQSLFKLEDYIRRVQSIPYWQRQLPKY